MGDYDLLKNEAAQYYWQWAFGWGFLTDSDSLTERCVQTLEDGAVAVRSWEILEVGPRDYLAK